MNSVFSAVALIALSTLIGCTAENQSVVLGGLSGVQDGQNCKLPEVEDYFADNASDFNFGNYLTRTPETVRDVFGKINSELFQGEAATYGLGCSYEIDHIYRRFSNVPYVAQRYEFSIDNRNQGKTFCGTIRFVSIGWEKVLDRATVDALEEAQRSAHADNYPHQRPVGSNEYRGEQICVGG